jgi:hypothetical protein
MALEARPFFLIIVQPANPFFSLCHLRLIRPQPLPWVKRPAKLRHITQQPPQCYQHLRGIRNCRSLFTEIIILLLAHPDLTFPEYHIFLNKKEALASLTVLQHDKV